MNYISQHQKSWNVANKQSKILESDEDSPPCSESELLMANSDDTDIFSDISLYMAVFQA